MRSKPSVALGAAQALGELEALGALENPQAVVALIQTFKKPKDCDLAVRAVGALGRIGPPAIPALLQALKVNPMDWGVEANVVKVLVEIGSPAVPALVEILKEQSLDYIAVNALRKIGDSQAALGLIEVLKDKDIDPMTQVRIRAALLQIGSPAVPALIQALGDKEAGWWMRYKAANLLGEISDPQAVPVLIEALQGNTIGEEAAKALKLIAQNRPVAALRAALPILRRLRKSDPLFPEALAQIEAATAAFKDLPVPAAAPPLDAQTLPRPVAAADVPMDASAPKSQGWWRRLCRKQTPLAAPEGLTEDAKKSPRQKPK